jgi:uncharacterized protein (DUF924 family)
MTQITGKFNRFGLKNNQISMLRSATFFYDPYSAKAIASAFQHKEIIARFGRFPHRNAILGRISTPEEEEFLASTV